MGSGWGGSLLEGAVSIYARRDGLRARQQDVVFVTCEALLCVARRCVVFGVLFFMAGLFVAACCLLLQRQTNSINDMIVESEQEGKQGNGFEDWTYGLLL